MLQDSTPEELKKKGFHLELVGKYNVHGNIESLSVAYLSKTGCASLIICCSLAKVSEKFTLSMHVTSVFIDTKLQIG